MFFDGTTDSTVRKLVEFSFLANRVLRGCYLSVGLLCLSCVANVGLDIRQSDTVPIGPAACNAVLLNGVFFYAIFFNAMLFHRV